MRLWTTAIVTVTAAMLFHLLFRSIPLAALDFHASRPDATHTMRAIVYDRHGGPDVLRLEPHHPMPVLQDHQLLVHVHASALNPVDFKYRRNTLPRWLLPKPKIPGHDVSGVVVQVGKKAASQKTTPKSSWQVGDRVCAMIPSLLSPWGTLAEYVAVDASLVAHVGPRTSLLDAASFPLVSLTAIQAFQNLNHTHLDGPNHNNSNSKRMLIHAGAGGVGTFAVQYAKKILHMEHVAVTASTAKAERMRALGADQVLDYRNLNEAVLKDFDAVLDPMSWAYEERTLSSLKKPSGHYLNILSSDWAFDPGRGERSIGFMSLRHWIQSKLFHSFKLGSTIPRYSLIAVQPNGVMLQEVMDLVDQEIIVPVVDRIFPLEEAAAAFVYLEQGHATGKVVVDHHPVKTATKP